MRDEIYRVIERVRGHREEEVTVPGMEGAPLVGECHENAIALAHELDKMGYTVEIAAGGLDFIGEPAPKTFFEARKDGQHHFWVVVEGTLHADLASERRGKRGEPFVLPGTPAEYVFYGSVPYESGMTPSSINRADFLRSA